MKCKRWKRSTRPREGTTNKMSLPSGLDILNFIKAAYSIKSDLTGKMAMVELKEFKRSKGMDHVHLHCVIEVQKLDYGFQLGDAHQQNNRQAQEYTIRRSPISTAS